MSRIDSLRSTARPFVRGPIPLDWVTTAAAFPGKALHVAIAIWYLAGLKKTHEFPMSRRMLRLFGVGGDAARDSLRRLESAGLVAVQRRPGCSNVISILPVPFEFGTRTAGHIETRTPDAQ